MALNNPANKITNEYTRALGNAYGDIPKAVFAAVAVSFAVMRGDSAGNEIDPADAVEPILREWAALHAAGIVPQAPWTTIK